MAWMASSSVVGIILLLLVGIQTVQGCGRSRPRRCPPRDRTPPTLTCPGNIVVNNKPIQNHQKVTWVEPVANDNGKSITPSRVGPAPGLLFSEGVTTITYSAKDNSGNVASCSFTITVKVIRCTWFQRQTDGWKWCHPSFDMRYGGDCWFGCYGGFKLNGPSEANCLESGKWDIASQPTCDKRTCPALYRPQNVKDITCTDAYYYRSICSYNCNEGYGVPQGTSKVRVCGSLGGWIGREPSCVDVTRPVFTTCPYVVSGYAEATKTSGRVSWNQPPATDNSNEYVQVAKTLGPSPGDELAVGEHPVSYTATDSAGNTATCNFNVIVKQIRCHALFPLPYTSVVCPNGHILGSSCDFSCDEGSALSGESYTQCQRSTTSVPYGIWSFNNNQPYCELVDLCPEMIPPANGAVACDTWQEGRFCQMFCQSGYVTVETKLHTLIHVCNNGEWPFGNELPDCFKINRTLRFFELELSYQHLTYKGVCTEDHAEITGGFVHSFEMVYGQGCIQATTCSLTSFEITCGEQTDDARKRRDATGGFSIKVTMELSKDMTTKEMLDARNGVKSTLETGFTTVINGDEYTDGVLTVTQIGANCFSGSVFNKRNNACIQCKQGYYHNTVTDTCTKCPKGTYQELVGKTSCTPCPDGETTVAEGTISEGLCLEACTIGMYSTYGTTPCSQCGLGTYTDVTASTSCHVCPGMKTTLTAGTTSSDQCTELDIQYIALEEGDDVVPAMITVNTTTADTELFMWFYYKFTDCLNILRITNGDTVLLELTQPGDLIATVLGSSFTHTTPPVSDVWHYINVSLKESTVEMFVDEIKVISGDVAGLTVPNAVNVTLGGSECVGTFSQFNMNSTAGTSTRSRTTCFTEMTGDLLSWKQFLETGGEGTFYKIHSQCDVIDNCDSAPCQNGGECTDLYLDFSCACADGYSGSSCEIDIDDCQSHACDNNATCVDGSNSYTCHCSNGFKGELCEIKVVDGKWATWGDWSACSVSCGNGTWSRERVCDDPAPDNGGLECAGNSTETGVCQERADSDEECINECSVPPTVTNGNVTCDVDETDGETIICVPECNDGYDFDSDFMIVNSTIFCGRASSYRWSIRNEDNPNMTLPSCMEKLKATGSTLLYKADYHELHPDILIDGGAQIDQVIGDKVSSAECIVNNQCKMDFAYDSVDYSGRRRRSTIGTSVTITVSCVPRTANVEECYDYLAAITTILNTAVTNVELTVTYNGVDHDVNVNSTTVDGYVVCDSGNVPVLHYCISCGNGMYQYGEYCERCPRGTYQDQEGQLTCKQCPDGWTTHGLQSENVTDCSVELVLADDVTSIVLMVALSVAGAVVVILLAVISFRFYYKHKSSKRPVTPLHAEPTELHHYDNAGNTHFREAQTQPGRYGAANTGNDIDDFFEKKINVFTLPDYDISEVVNNDDDFDDGFDEPRPKSRSAWT